MSTFNWLRSGIWPALKEAVSNWQRHDGATLSAALAYYAALSLFPLCLTLMAGIGLLTRVSPLLQDRQRELLAAVQRNASPWVAEQLQAMLSGIEQSASFGGPIGLASLLLAAIGIFVQVENLFDRVWELRESRPRGLVGVLKNALVDRLTAFLMLLGIGGMVLLVIVLNLSLTALRPYVLQWGAGHTLWQIVQSLTTLVLNALFFTVVFKTLPKAAVPWRAAAAGGLLTTLIWQVGMRLLEWLVISDHYTPYGVVGSFLAVMLWMYYASAVVFFGVEFVRTLASSRPAA